MTRKRIRTAPLLILLLLLAQTATAILALPSPSKVEYRTCTVHIAAVSSAGGGVLGNLTVTVAYPGRGRVFISTSPAAEIDTQGSARIAAFAASLLAGVPMDKYDFYYDIESPSIIVGGPSAGAEMAVATYMLLTGQKCNASIVATGMIQPDTTIGPVGGLKEKLEAVAAGGGKIFVVPAGQQVYTYYETKIVRKGPFTFITREPVTVNLTLLGEKLGVKVYTAASLLDLAYIEEHGKPPVIPHTQINTSLSGVPEQVVSTVWEAYHNMSRLYNNTMVQIGNADKQPVKTYLAEAENLNARAQAMAGQDRPYAAYVLEDYAASYAEAALALDRALNDDLNVTSLVDAANATLQQAWTRAGNISLEGSVNKLYSQIKTYELLGLASYYYTAALDQLDRNGASYYIPWSIFSGLQTKGLDYMAESIALARLSLFWSNITLLVGGGSGYNMAVLARIATLLSANAKTITAYASTLLQEAGGDTSLLNPSLYLVDEAITSKNPVQMAAYSLASIVEATSAIQESFPLDTERIVEELAWIDTGMLAKTNTTLLKLTLNAYNLTGDTETNLKILSEVLLEAWLVNMVAGHASNTTIIASNPPAIPNAGTSQQGASTTSIKGKHQTTRSTQAGNRLLQVGTALGVTIIVLIVILWRATRTPRTPYPKG